MITRNLQNASKTASNSHKFALQHAHKRNIMTINNKLLSNPISSSSINLSSMNNNTTSTSSSSSNLQSMPNPALIHHSKYRFSKETPRLLPSTIADIIPSNIKLSEKQKETLQQTFTDLSNSEQNDLIQLITEQLKGPRKPLQKALLKRIKAIDKS